MRRRRSRRRRRRRRNKTRRTRRTRRKHGYILPHCSRSLIRNGASGNHTKSNWATIGAIQNYICSGAHIYRPHHHLPNEIAPCQDIDDRRYAQVCTVIKVIIIPRLRRNLSPPSMPVMLMFQFGLYDKIYKHHDLTSLSHIEINIIHLHHTST